MVLEKIGVIFEEALCIINTFAFLDYEDSSLMNILIEVADLDEIFKWKVADWNFDTRLQACNFA